MVPGEKALRRSPEREKKLKYRQFIESVRNSSIKKKREKENGALTLIHKAGLKHTWKWFFFWQTNASSATEKTNPLSVSTVNPICGLRGNINFIYKIRILK